MVVQSPENSSAEEDPDTTPTLNGRKWVSLHEFARIVGVTYQTALRYKDLKNIEVVQVGGRFRVYLEELERFQREGNKNG